MIKRLPWLIIVLFTLTACSSKPVDFYLLSPMLAKIKQQKQLRLVVGPVKISPYLETPQIVTRITEEQVKLSEHHRWAEPLRANITRALIENLKTILHTAYVIPYPKTTTSKAHYQVAVNILRFDTNAQGLCVLIADWEIINPQSGKIIKIRSFKVSSYVTRLGNYNAIVAAMSHNLRRLSYAIAKNI